MATTRRPATEAEARVLASALRLRILRLCLDRALTNKELAQHLEVNPATMLHHVRKLVETDFLVAEGVRRGTRGSREVPYRATGKSWTLSVGESGPSSQAMVDAFLQEVAFVDLDKTYMSRIGLRLTDVEYSELTERLQDVLDEFERRPPSPHGRAFSLFVNIHPDVVRDAVYATDADRPTETETELEDRSA